MILSNADHFKIIVVTIPKRIMLQTVINEILMINNFEDQIGNHKIGRNKPQAADIEGVGFVHDGELKYLADYIQTIEIEDGFDCTTTGKHWDQGNYIQFENVRKLETKIALKGFQGFRYMNLKKGIKHHGKNNKNM